MNTPKQLGIAETLAQISGYFSSHCTWGEARQVTCRTCRAEIARVRAYMSLHDEERGEACSGPGRAWRMEIPYCPNCEPVPSRYGCIHLSEAEMKLPVVIEASRAFGAVIPLHDQQRKAV
jgi:hypothetical protein